MSETSTELWPNPFGDPFATNPPIIYDRSTLQDYAECPRKGATVKQFGIKLANEFLDVGNATHDILSRAIGTRISDLSTPGELADVLRQEGICTPRTDVQPRVAQIMDRCAWSVARIIAGRDVGDILRYDGGKGKQSGQLSMEIYPETEKRGAVIATAEVDLLLATPSREELEGYDWKSGWTWWTATDVKDAFQFQMHAALVFENYPEVQRFDCRVFMLGENQATGVVTFERKYFQQYRNRIISAVDIALASDGIPSDTVRAWPSPEKCLQCQCVRECKDSCNYIKDIAENPADALESLAILTAEVERIETGLTTIVRKTTKDISTNVNGVDVCFGINKPKTERAATCKLYQVKK